MKYQNNMTKLSWLIMIFRIFCLNMIFANAIQAQNMLGLHLSQLIIDKDPALSQANSLFIRYYPSQRIWKNTTLYYDAGVSYFRARHCRSTYPHIIIYSVAPVLRYFFYSQKSILGPVKPYLELSIGLSYLSQIQFNRQKLGIHFAFQDRLGMGFAIGNNERYTLSIHTIHYSNGGLAKHNSGITIPMMLDIGYHFK